MKALRALLTLALLAIAVAPLVFHFSHAASYLVRNVGRAFAVVNLVGCVAWLWICWQLWRPAPRAEV